MPPRAKKRSNQKQQTHSTVIQEIKMPAIQLRLGAVSVALALLAATSSPSFAQKKYDIGATDTEIKIGNIMPYSGPASGLRRNRKTEEAYMRKINAEGGINGRKINFVSYDDNYSRRKRWSRPASWWKATRSC